MEVISVELGHKSGRREFIVQVMGEIRGAAQAFNLVADFVRHMVERALGERRQVSAIVGVCIFGLVAGTSHLHYCAGLELGVYADAAAIANCFNSCIWYVVVEGCRLLCWTAVSVLGRQVGVELCGMYFWVKCPAAKGIGHEWSGCLWPEIGV
jgi:hypothetical protein